MGAQFSLQKAARSNFQSRSTKCGLCAPRRFSVPSRRSFPEKLNARTLNQETRGASKACRKFREPRQNSFFRKFGEPRDRRAENWRFSPQESERHISGGNHLLRKPEASNPSKGTRGAGGNGERKFSLEIPTGRSPAGGFGNRRLRAPKPHALRCTRIQAAELRAAQVPARAAGLLSHE